MVGGLYSGVLAGRYDGMALMSLAIVALLAVGGGPAAVGLQRSAARLPTGGIAWQLAVRRLQLDSSTPAQVVAGICVVLAGAIALQPLITLLGSDRTGSATSGVSGTSVEQQLGYRIFVSGPTAAELTAVVDDVAAANGVRTVVGGVPIGGTVGAAAPMAPGQEIDSTGYFSAEVAPVRGDPRGARLPGRSGLRAGAGQDERRGGRRPGWDHHAATGRRWRCADERLRRPDGRHAAGHGRHCCSATRPASTATETRHC